MILKYWQGLQAEQRMNALEQQAKNETLTIIVITIMITFALFIGAFWYWQSNKSELNQEERERLGRQPIIETPNLTQSVPQIQPPRTPTNPRQIFECKDSSGNVTLSDNCPAGTTVRAIDASNPRTGARIQVQQNQQQRQGQKPNIVMIRNAEPDIKRCQDYYNPIIRRIQNSKPYTENDRKRIETLRRQLAECIIAAQKGMKYPPVLI